MRNDTARHRRSRNRGGNGGGGGGHGHRRSNGGGNNRTQVFDSNGPDVRIRGTAYQILEKYTVLAKDAAAAGDRILSESYLQHAEHYQRVINSWHEHSMPAYDADRAQASNEGEVRVERTDQPRETDLGLPESILGPKAQAPELTEA